MIKKICGFLWLESIWLILWQSISPLTIFDGILAIIFIVRLFNSPKIDLDIKIKPLQLCKIIVLFLLYLIQASFLVAWYAIRPIKTPSSEVFLVQSGINSELISVLIYDFLILIPGTVVVEIEPTTSIIHVHNLNASKKDTFYRQFYAIEKLFHKTFQSHLPYKTSYPEKTE